MFLGVGNRAFIVSLYSRIFPHQNTLKRLLQSVQTSKWINKIECSPQSEVACLQFNVEESKAGYRFGNVAS